ncbi:MAG: DUF4256 domain-containing protein [Leptospiraceae bacterium]|nr:DUF4256 domain-containing protein [Leptospiraceae bacterium]
MNKHKEISTKEKEELLGILKSRFEKFKQRHKNIEWTNVQKKIETSPDKLWSLNEMEKTGGEPDVVGFDKKNGEYIFYDCSIETPKHRRSICFDREALDKRKENKPKNDAMSLAKEIGIKILTEEEYYHLQELGDFDLKTSSWIETPEKIRKLGGALFCDKRYDTVFTYHNGADSYYAVRGFRGSLRV